MPCHGHPPSHDRSHVHKRRRLRRVEAPRHPEMTNDTRTDTTTITVEVSSSDHLSPDINERHAQVCLSTLTSHIPRPSQTAIDTDHSEVTRHNQVPDP